MWFKCCVWRGVAFIKRVLILEVMKAVLCEMSPVKYLMMRGLSGKFKSLVYGPLCLARVANVAEPTLVDDSWVKIHVTHSGICGSDIGGLSAHESLYLEPYISEKFVLGHENVGVVCEVGGRVKNVKVGDRVVTYPFLACAQRGFSKKDFCEYCACGDYALCENVNEGHLPKGLSIGWNARTSGGWGEYFVAHSSQVFRISKKVSDASAVMVDSFSCALHAVMQNPPKKRDVVMVYGCGTMGLNTIAALRGLGYKNKIVGVYSRGFQKSLAESFGCDATIHGHGDVFSSVARMTKAKMYSLTIGKPTLEGGVDVMYDCVATSDTITNSLRFLRGKGRYVMIATAGEVGKVDLAPLWFRELSMIGSCEQGHEQYNKKMIATYQLAINMIEEEKVVLDRLVTHMYPFTAFKRGLKVAIHKKNNAVKVALFNPYYGKRKR